MVTITLYVRQQKRHRCIEQSFGLCGRMWGWDDLGEWHWNMYVIICETNRWSRFDAWYRMLGAGALGLPRGMGWRERWEGVQDGEHEYTRGRFMSMYGKTNTTLKVISLQFKYILKKKKTPVTSNYLRWILYYSLQFSHSVMSDSLRAHEPQHTRPPCPSPAPGVYPNPCPSSQ